MNKRLLSFVSSVLIFGMSVSAADFTAISDSQAGKVKVQINTDAEYKKPILLYLTDENIDEGITSTNVSQKLVAFSEASGSDGNYSAELLLPDDIASGWYLVTIEDYRSQNDIENTPLAERQTRVYVADSAEIKEALESVNSATVSSIGAVFEKYKDVFNVVLDEDYNKNTDKAFVVLKSEDLKTLEEVYNTFKEAKAVGALKSATKENMGTVLEKYGEIIGIELTEDYQSYSDDVAKLLNLAYSNTEIDKNCKEIFLGLYNEMVAVAAVNNSDRSKIDKVLEKYNDIFKLDLSGKYRSTDKIEFNKALERKNFKSAKEVKAAFDAALASIKKNSTQSSSGSGGGSSGVGKSTTTYTPVINTDTQKPNDNDAQSVETELKFTDLENVAWAEEAIYALAKKKIVSGYDDNSFKPGNDITRNEFITMLVLAFDLLDTEAKYDFTDGEENAWYAKYVASAKKAGILAGYEDGSFGDGEKITRQDMAVFVYRLTGLGVMTPENIFDDDKNIAAYAKDAVYTLNSKGIINGMGNNCFEPLAFATRAQAARILYSVMGGENVD